MQIKVCTCLPYLLICVVGLLPMGLFAQLSFEQRSDPAGIFSTSTQIVETNASVTSHVPSLFSGNYAFSHWELDGVRMTDTNGSSLVHFSFVIRTNAEAVATYLDTSTDTDFDGIPDWFEMRHFGTLQENADSDRDGDGIPLVTEYKNDLNPSRPDQLFEGGISRRRSLVTFVNLGGARKLTLASSPPGLVASEIRFPEVNSTFLSPNLSGLNAGYYFSHWEVNGQRVSDSAGVGLSQVVEVMNEDKNVVAQFYHQDEDSDGDQIPDWFEWHEFGTLQNTGDSDPDGDGLTISQERNYGLSAAIIDRLEEGGVSRRRSNKTFVNFGGAKRVEMFSDPRGLLASQTLFEENNASFQSPSLSGEIYGFAFSHWEVNGVRIADSAGVGLNQVNEVLTEDKTLVAKYYDKIEDLDGDGLPDWIEWRNFGGLLYSEHSDPDGDGLALSEETKFGLSGAIFDQFAEGGVSRRRALRTPYVFDPNAVLDSDEDGLSDDREAFLGTDANSSDTDGDGYEDGVEYLAGSNPLLASSFPNVAPDDLWIESNLTVYENTPVGSEVLQFFVSDPNDANHTGVYQFRLLENESSSDGQYFSIDLNGSLRVAQELDYEILQELNQTKISLVVRVSDELGASLDRTFLAEVLNVVEDLDGDGVEDYFDLDDDGDGFSDEEELSMGTDPQDAESSPNAPPHSLVLDGVELLENRVAGTVVGKLSAQDPDANDHLTYIKLSGDEIPFAVSNDGSVQTDSVLDFETDPHAFILLVRVFDERNASLDANFSIQLLNEVEDLDGDGVEDHFDLDEDGDGFSDEVELENNFDPRNQWNYPELPIISTMREVVESNDSIGLGLKIHATGGVESLEVGVQLLDQSGLVVSEQSRQWVVGEDIQVFFMFDEVDGMARGLRYRAFAENIAGGSIGQIVKIDLGEKHRWWSGDRILPGGWIESNWLGTFLPNHDNEWIYHVELGWLYAKPDSAAGLWLWMPKELWLWTNADVWPFLWSDTSEGWMYPIYSLGKRYFYDYTTESLR